MKAIVLVSGGLDSIISIKYLLNQGFDVLALHFYIPFEHQSKEAMLESSAARYCRKWGCEFRIVDISRDFLELVKNPAHGYGKNMNPCVDCKIFMIKKAASMMEAEKADCIASGEVMGQRPMSQQKHRLRQIEKQCGLEGRLFRPLSAALLPPTIVDEKGAIKREEMLAISGRSRREQMALAKAWGIEDYPSPAGGCLLTEADYSGRISWLIKQDQLGLEEVELAKQGRWFSPSSESFLCLGRNERENREIEKYVREEDIFFFCEEFSGPSALLRGDFSHEALEKSAALVAFYAKKGRSKYNINYRHQGRESQINSEKMDKARIEEIRI